MRFFVVPCSGPDPSGFAATLGRAVADAASAVAGHIQTLTSQELVAFL